MNRRILGKGPPRREAPPADSEESTEGQDHTNIATTYTDRSLCIVPPRRPRVDLAAAAIDAERGLLTSMLRRPEIVVRVATIVDVAQFLERKHQAVFRAMVELGEIVDGPSLRAALRRSGSDDLVRFAESELAIFDAPGVWSLCWQRHAADVTDYARRRRAVEIFAAGQDDARDLARPLQHSIALAIEALQGGAP